VDIPVKDIQMVKKNLQLLLTSEVGDVSWLIGCPKTSVKNYHHTLCNIPQEDRQISSALQRKPEIMQEQNNSLNRQRHDVADHLQFNAALEIAHVFLAGPWF
jgi:hypothetical protein